jgi:hypothetical protein
MTPVAFQLSPDYPGTPTGPAFLRVIAVTPA